MTSFACRAALSYKNTEDIHLHFPNAKIPSVWKVPSDESFLWLQACISAVSKQKKIIWITCKREPSVIAGDWWRVKCLSSDSEDEWLLHISDLRLPHKPAVTLCQMWRYRRNVFPFFENRLLRYFNYYSITDYCLSQNIVKSNESFYNKYFAQISWFSILYSRIMCEKREI